MGDVVDLVDQPLVMLTGMNTKKGGCFTINKDIFVIEAFTQLVRIQLL